jgi:hypothetical protein
LSSLRRVAGRDISDIYLIGITHKDFFDDSPVLLHELSHAFFYIDPIYRDAVMAELESMPSSERRIAEQRLMDEGYYRGIIIDEIVAQNVAMIGSRSRDRLIESIGRNGGRCVVVPTDSAYE